ncbi:MAG: poly-gamma-glutamate synthase PgsB [Bacteroidetes bacterium]|nr:poly-gamma-glutamate synthase PgsB [Bacteroidota bacterium]
MNIVLVLTLFVAVLLFVERFSLQRLLNNIPLRIHVNGTRGKSSVTEYLAIALRGSGKHPFAKITGVIPTQIFPNGRKNEIQRRGTPRVQEQLRMIRRAVQERADSLVLECMSVAPEYQKIESQILQPHISLLTNIRDDHFEQMGKSDEEHVEALRSALREGSIVFTRDEEHFPQIQQYASDRKIKAVLAPPLEEAFSKRLPSSLHADNIALTLSVCEYLNIDKEQSFQKIIAENLELLPPVIHFTINKKIVIFHNAFTINDVVSTNSFVENKLTASSEVKQFIVFNTRNDRPLRTQELAIWMSHLTAEPNFILCGNHSRFAERELKKNNVNQTRITIWDRITNKDVRNFLDKESTQNIIMFGVGNIADGGFKILRCVKEISEK